MALLDRYPVLVWAGAGLLGWVAGDIMVKDSALLNWFPASTVDAMHHFPIGPLHLNVAGVLGAVLVLGAGYLILKARRPAAELSDV
jgi:predicted tellurium resistance membrane protein TerC